MTTVDVFATENAYGAGEVRSWASILEDNPRAQAEAISRVPIVKDHVALMPDAHFGFGPPVGSAIVTAGGVMPYAVGVDIGCGMYALQTEWERGDFVGVEGNVLGALREHIPSGVGQGRSEPLVSWHTFVEDSGPPPGLGNPALEMKRGPLVEKRAHFLGRAAAQFGTLGSGNHFVELCTDPEGSVWLLLHSGSRGIGNVLATAHVRRAKEFCKHNGIAVEDAEFSYSPSGTQQYRDYLADMGWAQAYAYAQRDAMMQQFIQAVEAVLVERLSLVSEVNCHHNYAEVRGDGTILTRKGAIDASVGKRGVIPGSMGAATYIVEGLGNEEAYRTSPHGAGRVRGRKDARAHLSVETFKKQMAGRTWQDREAEKLLDEAPEAYKPIEQVMADSASLIRPITVLSQFINYKGL